jgi:predicted phage terminase large subunit-like protein
MLSDEEWQKLKTNRASRLALTRQSFDWFFHLYFSHYISHKTADFQHEMMAKASNPLIEHLVIMAFRGSGKSSIVTTAFPIWAIVGELEKKYVLIVSQTQQQANQHLKNIAQELEGNELMKKDLWPYDFEQNETGASVLTLPKFQAKIIALGREQSMRGLRNGPYRPDLIISDDVEDSNSTKTSQGRASTFNWFTGELLPLGGFNTKYITIGNLLHRDSLLMRLRESIENGTRVGEFLEYPLVDDKRTILWPDRFPDMAAVQLQERRVANIVTWQREYLLHLVPDEDQIITTDMIHYYKEIPDLLHGEPETIIIGVDLAISQNNWSDYTSMIVITVRGSGSNLRMYIHPWPLNARLQYPGIKDAISAKNNYYHRPKFYIEQVAFQAALVQELKQAGFNVNGVNPQADKRTRLSMISDKITRGIILFPAKGAEALITQLTGFGVEKHDDLVDALTIAVIEHTHEENSIGTVKFVNFDLYQFARNNPFYS